MTVKEQNILKNLKVGDIVCSDIDTGVWRICGIDSHLANWYHITNGKQTKYDLSGQNILDLLNDFLNGKKTMKELDCLTIDNIV